MGNKWINLIHKHVKVTFNELINIEQSAESGALGRVRNLIIVSRLI